MRREIDITDYESTIYNKVRKMTAPSEEVIFDENHRILVYHCSVYGNECSLIRFITGIDISDSFEYGHASVDMIAEEYLDYQIGNTDDPLILAYYWYCYTQIGRIYDNIPGINHDLKGRVALLSVFNTFEGFVNTSYITDRHEPDSVITFKDKQTALSWYEEDYSDIKIFTIPAVYVDTFEYTITPHRQTRLR